MIKVWRFVISTAAQDNRLEMDVHSSSRNVDPVDCQQDPQLPCTCHRAISHEFLHVSFSTFASRIYSMDGLITFLALPAFTIAVVTQDVSRWRFCSHRSKFQSV